MKDIEILKCPFCGKEPNIYRCPSEGEWGNPYFAQCQTKECVDAEIKVGFARRFLTLIERWNFFVKNLKDSPELIDQECKNFPYLYLPDKEYLEYKKQKEQRGINK